MGKFDEALQTVTAEGYEGTAEEMKELLISAHQHDFDSFKDIADAKVTSLSEQLATTAATISTLKAANYDLLQAVPKAEEPKSNESNDSDGEIDIDDLFGEQP